ncbi:acetate kinase [Skermanella aerolata]|uniref:Acetate kinase n=1 Tax=Skermanella aerolata TaxID=393310 RepID=A0A512DRN5_9PROT|nr:acetate/propionate family kinase [Skermanella aerolata]KJB95258.1 acetate kinase [Skermanella aerolata KACC 11604]GEO38880.1 acetate kinase [Skermanella aerolata]
MSDSILVLNAGSSSIKFSVQTPTGPDTVRMLAVGQIEGIGTHTHFIAKSADGAVLAETRWPDGAGPANHDAALHVISEWLDGFLGDARVLAVGHRVVHGGSNYTGPVAITPAVMAKLRELVPLAPLHQPHNLAPIEAVGTRYPGVLQVACFDTSFHRGHSFAAEAFAIPYKFYEQGVRRYGFHGLSYEYVSRRLLEIAPDIAHGKVVVAHLGNGASMCAISDGASVESTMGFTALDGLAMGTRSGQLDPGVLLHLMGSLGMTVPEVTRLLYHESGLKGLSGISSDMRDLEQSADPHAAAAIDYFVYAIRKQVGALAAAMGGIDALIFTAGIGENSANVRRRVCDGLQWLGVDLDGDANDHGADVISAPGSRTRVMIVRTSEETMIALHALEAMSAEAVA